MAHLAYPWAGSYPLTQPFGVTTFEGEPPGYVWPDGSVSYFTPGGTRHDHVHSGLDFGLPCGTPIRAPADGVVTFAGWDDTGYGTCLRVHHPALGITTLYGHLSALHCAVGQSVTTGTPMALSGTTGNSNGCHCHLSCIRDSDNHYIDPTLLLTTPAPPPSKPPMPADSVHYVTFTVKTMPDGPTRCFDGPSTKLVQMDTFPPGTTLTCDAWCDGEPRYDYSVNAWDRRWLHVQASHGQWVASAHVIGNPPQSNP